MSVTYLSEGGIMKKFYFNKAFTLSEVLITLGVIGVVAAITIPGLISAYNKHIVETRLKATYSTILQAFRMYQAQFGDFSLANSEYEDADVNGYSWQRSKDIFDAFFAPVFVGATAYPKDTTFNIYSVDGSTQFASGNQRYTVYFALSNGTVLGFVRAGNYDGCIFTLILHPQKNKLIVGRDVLSMGFQADASGTYSYKTIASRRYSNDTRADFIENCKSTVYHPQYSTQVPDFCTVLIIRNGFKIPDDYPIKM